MHHARGGGEECCKYEDKLMEKGYDKVSTSVLLTSGVAYDTFLCFAEMVNLKG
jgi:hypothetical protein